MPPPLTGKGLVVKPLDGPQALRPGKPGNVFPFLVTLQHLDRNGAGKLFVDATVLFEDEMHELIAAARARCR